MASPYNGVASNESWENLRRPQTADDGINVGKTERLVSAIAGAAVIGRASCRERV